MVLNDRLELFQNMLLCCHDLYLWTYDQDMVLEHSNCPQAGVVSGLLAIGNRMGGHPRLCPRQPCAPAAVQ